MLGCCCRCSEVRSRAETWVRDYDRIQSSAVLLIYVQMGCGLVGSVGARYNGVAVVELAISLLGLVAIESSSQRLGRTYALLLFCSILLDVSWFILFAHHIWFISPDTFGAMSLKLTLLMQILGFSFRLLSSCLWIQMYRLGLSSLRDPTTDTTTSFLSPATPSHDQALGGSIYDPAYYSSLFQDAKPHHMCSQNHIEPTSSEASEARSLLDSSFHDENAPRKLQSV